MNNGKQEKKSNKQADRGETEGILFTFEIIAACAIALYSLQKKEACML